MKHQIISPSMAVMNSNVCEFLHVCNIKIKPDPTQFKLDQIRTEWESIICNLNLSNIIVTLK